MKTYPELHEIIDLPRILEDDIVPNSENHIVYITNPDKSSSTPRIQGEFVPIIIPGFQWDYLWWIYRFRTDSEANGGKPNMSFPMFLNEYLEEVYRKYLNKQ